MKVLGLVPARGASRRVPGKNLERVGGRSLVRRALETSLEAECFAPVALSSDAEEILAEADGLRVERIERPAELATATARSYDVAFHALRELEERGLGPVDAVAIVQCTSPFTAPEDLAGTVGLLETSGADSAVSIVRLDAALHPLKLKQLEGNRLLPWLEDDAMMPSHELPPLWMRNGSIYVSRREVLESGRLVGDDVRGYVMPRERSHDIDTPRDLAFARFLLETAPGYPH